MASNNKCCRSHLLRDAALRISSELNRAQQFIYRHLIVIFVTFCIVKCALTSMQSQTSHRVFFFPPPNRVCRRVRLKRIVDFRKFVLRIFLRIRDQCLLPKRFELFNVHVTPTILVKAFQKQINFLRSKKNTKLSQTCKNSLCESRFNEDLFLVESVSF